MSVSPYIAALNRRLGDSLGLVCGGSLPRFAWKYAPDQPRYVYDTDDRTLLTRTWADAPAPDGQPLGKVWLMAEWRLAKNVDHYGFGKGVRVPFIREADYAPYFETALAPGVEPDAELTQNYIRALDYMIQRSFNDYMNDEHWSARQNNERDRKEHRERAFAQYDQYTGAFGNLEPGKRDGYLSFQNKET